MDNRSFARGARIKPKEPERPNVPINEEISFPELIAATAIYTVRDYKIRDRERFLKFCAAAFDSALRSSDSASDKP